MGRVGQVEVSLDCSGDESIGCLCNASWLRRLGRLPYKDQDKPLGERAGRSPGRRKEAP